MRLRSSPIRLLVVEDSPTSRNLLVALFGMTSDIQVIGTALDGKEAVRMAVELRPDVITMDIHMPRMNGLEATRQILRVVPIPIIIVTATVNQPDMDLSFEAIRAGALTVVKKPGLNDQALCDQVIKTVRLMADVRVVRRWNTGGQTPTGAALPGSTAQASAQPAYSVPQFAIRVPVDGQTPKRQIVAIASSTGGPNALVNVLRPLPANYPLPILVVQHITSGFAASLAEWLNKELSLQVRLAQQGETPTPGTVLIAPDDRHMQISNDGRVLLHSSPPYKGLRPSANYLFFSLAQVYGKEAVGIILTGMGDDGVDGLMEVHNQGGFVLAQNEASCVVYGMPREAVARKVVDHVLSLEQISYKLLQLPI